MEKLEKLRAKKEAALNRLKAIAKEEKAALAAAKKAADKEEVTMLVLLGKITRELVQVQPGFGSIIGGRIPVTKALTDKEREMLKASEKWQELIASAPAPAPAQQTPQTAARPQMSNGQSPFNRVAGK